MSKLGQLLKRGRVDPTTGRLKLRKRTKARARTTGTPNRRLITLDWWWWEGPNSAKTREPVKVELQYHFTKGYRERAV